jgi:hypothetical protein
MPRILSRKRASWRRDEGLSGLVSGQVKNREEWPIKNAELKTVAKSKLTLGHFLLVAVAALVPTLYSYLNNNPTVAGFGLIANMLDAIQLPAVFVGVAVSRNIHPPDVVSTYATFFLTYIPLIGAITWLLKMLFAKVSVGWAGFICPCSIYKSVGNKLPTLQTEPGRFDL